MYQFATTNVQFLASLPDSLGNLVLNKLTIKCIAVVSMLLVGLIQKVQQEIKELCCSFNVRKTMPKASTFICSRMKGTWAYNFPPFLGDAQNLST